MNVFSDRLIYPLAERLAGDPDLVDFRTLTLSAVLIFAFFVILTVMFVKAERYARHPLSARRDPVERIMEDIEASIDYGGGDEVTLTKDEAHALLSHADPLYKTPGPPLTPLRIVLTGLAYLSGAMGVIALFWALYYYTQA